ncbi:uncharacterized protein BDZ99DRAFT_484499 [Mytilinidion resinicola]|uniref:Cyclin N-terminal domain-containing protein n=1 Tax=Mytilinidion resinicola TaxID=574789 RepID=A0A6A6Z9N2_9PEZI|nr:uncharacterized protein BDZ99DRAFT_484499 [Mytilinidion resinicola]KAF2817740.1 hypothetical protein BDZ99DRAFT_484499 [Mytilinidion resinicola]
MDAKPQRPMRALRIRDENQPPQLPAGKTIHQRNKSTPALSTLSLAGGIKAAAKRTVFGDVSNTVRQQPAKDDLLLPGKQSAYDVLKDSAIVAAKELSKPTTLLRPAQRPLAPLALKPAQVNAPVLAASTLPKPPMVAAPTRKAISKKPTTIFRELDSEPLVEPLLPAAPLVSRPTTSTALVHQPLASRREVPSIEPREDPSINEALASVIVDTSKVYLPIDRPQSLSHHETKSGVTEVEERYVLAEEISTTEFHQKYEAVSDDTKDQYEYLEALEEQARVLEQERNDELARQSHTVPLPEAEEYWDEDEEEEYFDADGYTTARSLRSRGDNTTGGVTMVLAPRITAKTQRELDAAKHFVESMKTPEEVEDEQWDTSMVAEYGEEIFEYMHSLEERMKPNPSYMDHQAEIQWSMRSVLMDWLVQVHHRFTLLPETLFLSVNYVDRFLSCKVVSLGKLQLVGATALFIAAKYEEINCPSVQEIVYMVDGAYTVDEILKAERFMLSLLQFELGWPGPMSFLRRISKADDYDLETRTLAKYFLEITVMDERFVGCAPSFTSAGAHCLARLMLKKGEWSQAHVHYSGYTYNQLRQLISTMLECCESPQKHHSAVYEKYCDKRYKRASLFVESEVAKGFELPPMSRDSLAEQSPSWRRK